MARGNASFGENPSSGDRTSATSREQFVMDDPKFEGRRKKGCFVSRPLGVVALLVAAAVAAGVGVGVYFLAPPRDTKTAAQKWDDCGALAEERGECLCPASLTTTTPAPTTPPTAPTTPQPPVLPTGLRLNRTLLPSHYQVELTPRFYPGDDFGFNGSVVMDMTCEENTDVIVLHVDQLTVHGHSVMLTRTMMEVVDNDTVTMETPVGVVMWEEDVSRHFLKIWVNETLVKGATYRLSMTFNGTHIHPDWDGFYRSSYIEDGVTKYLVTTQFQRTHARRAFPCFDEPSFKATFDITLVRHENYSSISNMPLTASLDRGNGWVADVYNTTVTMSPYLLAFVVSEFKSKEMTTPRGTFMRLWARPKFINYLDYALGVSGPILEAYEDYTGIPFPISKTDQIAIPDFAAGAMENWGLVTYRETALLVNDDYTDTSSKRYVAAVISHELAHQWWGNLVTCQWWDETWLNEGFANNYADVMAAQAEPTWKMWFGNLVTCEWWDETWLNEGSADYFEDNLIIDESLRMNEYYIRTVWSALNIDGVATSQPVHVAGIEHHDELYKAFSSITYRKGGSVIRMMKYFLSEETFRRGISAYLNRHAYGSVRREDLYRALEEQAVSDGQVSWDTSRANFSDIMETWIYQMGHPVVDVTDMGNGELRIDQRHFLYDDSVPVPPSPLGPNGEYLWHIPLTYATKDQLAGNTSSRVWVYKDKSVTVPIAASSGWKLANVFEQGFFRIRYDNATWDAILEQLKTDHTVFPHENRGQLIDDAFNLARAGHLSELSALKATEYLVNETEYLPLYAGLVTRLRTIEGLLYPTKAQSLIYHYVYDLVRDAYAKTSWDNSDPKEHLEKYVRTMILRENCEKRHQPCLKKASELFAAFMADPDNNPIHPDFRAFVYCAAVDVGGHDELDFLSQRLVAMETLRHDVFISYERDALRAGLSCSRVPWLIKRSIERAVESGDVGSLLTDLARKWHAQDQVWDFLVENWNHTAIQRSRSGILKALTTYWSSDSHMKKVQSLASSFPAMPGDNAFVDAMEQMKRNGKWLEENEKPISDWLTMVNSGQGKTMSVEQEPEVETTGRRVRREVPAESLVETDLLQYQSAV